jgi:four helix bundle protein
VSAPHTNPIPAAKPFQTLEDLAAYQLAREFRKAMYGVSRRLPNFERFELASQIRRASVSLTNNVAEGHGRYHFLDQLKFLLQARGSLEELIDDLNVCFDENYLPLPDMESLKQLAWRVHNVINGYGRYLRQRKAGQKSGLKESPPPYDVDDNSDPFADLPF